MGHISTHDWVSRQQAIYQAGKVRSTEEMAPLDESFHMEAPWADKGRSLCAEGLTVSQDKTPTLCEVINTCPLAKKTNPQTW